MVESIDDKFLAWKNKYIKTIESQFKTQKEEYDGEIVSLNKEIESLNSKIAELELRPIKKQVSFMLDPEDEMKLDETIQKAQGELQEKTTALEAL